jgi:hypothetical protein
VAQSEEKAQAEQLKKHGAVKEALEQTTPPPEAHRIETRKSRAVRLVAYAALAILFAGFRVLLATVDLGLRKRSWGRR